MKRTIISTMCIVAALVLASSCNKIEEIIDPGDNTNTEENLGRTIINGVVESIGTKAELSFGYDVVWNTGDQIYVTTGTKDDTFTLSAGEGTTKGQFTEDNSKGITGNIEAFYPASLKTDDGYVWPAVQTNNQVTPMYAKQTITGAEGETVNFSSLGAMLQIGFNTQTNDIVLTSITLKDGNKPLSGKFTVTDGQAVLESNSENPGVTLDLGDGVPVGLTPKYFYIAIPAGEYKNLTIAFNSIDGKICEMKSTTFPEVKRNTVGKLTLTGSFENRGVILPGTFSIGNGVKGHFSRGNLFCTYTLKAEYSYAFENNQYDFRGRSELTTYNDAVIDGVSTRTPSWTSGLFQWMSINSWGYRIGDFGAFTTTTIDDCIGKETDVLEFGGTIDDSKWSVLTPDEWRYILQDRTNASSLLNCKVKVNGVSGAIIAPDDWDTEKYPIVGERSLSEYDKATWSKMETMGLVFMPNTYAMKVNSEGSAYGNDSYFRYWTNTGRYEDSAWSVNFSSGTLTGTTRESGLPVRLVNREYELYTVTFDANGHGVAPSPITGVKYGSTIDAPAEPTAKDANFDGWYTDQECTQAWSFFYTVTGNMTLYAKWIEFPDGALSSKFTVSENEQVHFSKGNLTCDISGTTPEWKFYDEQYDYATEYSATLISLFTWGYDAVKSIVPDGKENYNSEMTKGDLEPEEDWGSQIGDGNTWRTLTKDEWEHLFKTRENAADKYGYATVGGVYGIIILPDSFTDPMKNGGSGAFAPKITTGWNANVYTTGGNWEAMESAGAVFLPAAGVRTGSGVNFINGKFGSFARYWSSSNAGDGLNAYCVYFDSFDGAALSRSYHSDGCAIRLVTDVTE